MTCIANTEMSNHVTVAAEEAPVKEPEVIATAAFLEENTFNRTWEELNYARKCQLTIYSLDIVNGQKNSLTITLENKSNLNLTVLSVAGALTHPDTNALVKNVRVKTPSMRER